MLKIKYFVLFTLLICSTVKSEDQISETEVIKTSLEITSEATSKTKEESEDKSIAQEVLLYLPNRIFDLLDIVRLRVRLGPGFDVGIRITEPVSIYLGGHTAVYIGLPGPRLEPAVPLPFGAEAEAGASLSYLNGTTDRDTGPRHSETNIGVETQIIIVGIDVGIDPVEIADFFTGLFLLDLRSDDL